MGLQLKLSSYIKVSLLGYLFTTVVGKYASNSVIGRVDFAAYVSTCPLDVPTLTVAALVSGGPCGAVGAM